MTITEIHHNLVTAAFEAAEFVYEVDRADISNPKKLRGCLPEARGAMAYAIRKSGHAIPWPIITRLMTGQNDTSGVRMAYRRAEVEGATDEKERIKMTRAIFDAKRQEVTA